MGNAAQTQVSLDGKPVDLTSKTNNNVARLTIPKP
ncbi:MAG: RodZ domain-containing protein [Thiomonas sp.]